MHPFIKAFGNLFVPGILRLLLLCLLAYVVGWVALAWGAGALVAHFAGDYPGMGWLAGSAGGLIFAWFLFPLFYPILVSFFDDAIAEQVERNDYPNLPPAAPPFWPTLWNDIAFTLKAVLLNLLFLPLLIIPPLHVLVYYLLNGWLLGAQFFRMAAGRRVSKAEGDMLMRRHRGAVMFGGVAIMVCATIPFLNLIAPVLGVAAMVHLVHAVRNH